MKYILILFLFITATAHAEPWVCYDETTKEITKRVHGDCFKTGLCTGKDNAGLPANCFEAGRPREWDNALKVYQKVDMSVIDGSRIVPMTQSEIDAKEAPAKQAEADRVRRLNGIKTKLKSVGFTDEEVNLLLSINS